MMRDKLSDKRISEVSTKFNSVFRKWATAREIFDVVFVDDLQSDEDVQNDDFAKIGINQILIRNFFTEQKGDTFYDHTGIGLGYGKNIALGEMRYIFNIMVDCKDVIEFNKDDITNYLYQFTNGNSNTEGLVILMSPANLETSWGDNEFTYVNDKSLWGYTNHIPMYWSPVIPKDKFYIFNKNMGKIIVNTDAHIDISEISPLEYDSIIEKIPTVTKDELKERVRVKANEVIKFHTREDERTPARARAIILPEGVMIVDYVKDSVEKWIILPNSNFLTIFSHLGEETFIRSPESFEPHYIVRITQKKVEIEYFWSRDDKKVISLTNQDVRKIIDNMEKTGKLLNLDARATTEVK